MNALNIMHLLNEIDCNKCIDIRYVKNKSADWIEIETHNFMFSVDEYGTCVLHFFNQPKSVEKDLEYWNKVKDWIKRYYQENF